MKRISPATVTVGVLAIVAGLVAAFVVRQSMLPKPVAQVEKPPEAVVPVVVARVNLPVNTLVSEKDLQTLAVPVSRKVPEGALMRANIAVGRIVQKTIKAGQALKEDHLLAIGERLPGIADRLPEGHRALTIMVPHSNGSGPVVENDSYVDIAMSVEGSHPDLGELATRTILRSVKVVEVSSSASRTRDGLTSLTVAVTPGDANKLITAQQTGQLNVTLCSKADGASPLLEGDEDSITRRELLGLRELPAPVVPVPGQAFRVEQWRGGSMKVIELGQSAIQEAQRVNAPRPLTRPVATTSN